jgi:amino acid adenylation domain-containing protein
LRKVGCHVNNPETVVDLFRHQVALRPDAMAVVEARIDRYHDGLTYAQLDAWSEAMALQLIATGVGPGDRIAVYVPRSVELVVVFLAALKAGAGYVPIDDASPSRRIEEIISDADPTVIVCDPAFEQRLSGLGRPVWNTAALADAAGSPARTPRLPRVRPSDIAYLMYTSGSSGRPKAVATEHRNIVNLVRRPNYVELAPDDRVLQLAPAAFDASTFELWGALLNGALLVLAPPGPAAPDEISELLRSENITVLWLTAALFHLQIDTDPSALSGLRFLLAGGDVLFVSHVRQLMELAPGCVLVNGYGPTETTTFACCHRITFADTRASSVPIGKPVQNVDLRVVGGDGRELPDGEPGELWIGGRGVPRGYWRRQELTERSFVSVSFEHSEPGRYYRTGDSVLRRPDGVFEFLGRMDRQVKLHGHRIEPGEVENALTGHPQVKAAAVSLRPDTFGGPRLVAWVVPAGGGVDRRSVRTFLAELLPDYMVPTVFVMVDALPTTVNGKIDRRALPDPDWSSRSLYL